MKKNIRPIVSCILFIFLFSLANCIKLEIDLLGGKKKNAREKLIANLRKRKCVLREKISTLDKAIRKNLYTNPKKHKEVIALKKKFKKELSGITAKEQALVNECLKEDIDHLIEQKVNSLLSETENLNPE